MSGAGLEEFLGVAPTGEPNRWSCTVGPHLLTGAGAMQGGALFATALVALEGVARRPLAWATMQYLSHVGAGVTVDVDVTVDVAGHQMTQPRAAVSVDSNVVATAAGALGRRSFPGTGRWLRPPSVPSPEDCGVLLDVLGEPRSEVWDLRLAVGRQVADLDGIGGSGRTASWCRLPGGARPVSVGDLAIAGDFLMTHFSDALGTPCSGNSLDNTIRVATLHPTGWILLDAHIQFVGEGLGYGLAHLWAEDGSLLGTAGTTLVLRELAGGGLTARSNRRIISR